MAVTEDDIIRRRLLYDGDGTGDEKRITSILKTIVKWSTADCEEDERNLTYQKIIALLHQCEYSITKHHLAFLMNIKEQENYEKLYNHIKEKIIEARDEINTCKEELKQAKVVRKNKQEYDALAKIIEKHPDRKLTKDEISTLQVDIHELNEKKQSLIQKLEVRQKQFHVLIYSVQLLQQIINDDQSEDIENDSSTENKNGSTEVMDIS